jgi:hypothetical protein
MHRACGVIDPACTMHAVSTFRIRIYIQKGFSPLVRGPGRMF